MLGADDGDTPLSGGQLADLIEHSKHDDDAKKALAAATAAAAKNKKLMQSARDIVAESSRLLGKDAISIPSLSRGTLAEKMAKAGKGLNGAQAQAEADAEGRKQFLAERRFLSATKGAFDRP